MDAQRFDALARSFAARRSRRGLLTTLAAAALGLAAGGVGEAEAALRCHGDGDCAGRPGSVCHHGRCACPSETQACGAACVDLASDLQHCGSCHHACDAAKAEACVGGRCGCAVAGQIRCPDRSQGGEHCVDPQHDRDNCGDCGQKCPVCFISGGGGVFAQDRCQGGSCGHFDTIFSGYAPAVCGDDCVDLNTDRDHCGACANACGLGTMCVEGLCEACPKGTHACPGFPGCHDFAVDRDFCGGCGTPCPFGADCVGGVCRCPAGQTPCDHAGSPTCVDLQSDEFHCGSCAQACGNNRICRGGQCACPDPAQSVCRNKDTGAAYCVDLQTGIFGGIEHCGDCRSDCGSCGHECPLCFTSGGSVFAQDRCQGGSCGHFDTIFSGYAPALCGDQCVDTNSDAANCGSCGHHCDAGTACVQGSCGCPNGQHPCGPGCCAPNQLCCAHQCCAAGVGACDGPNGTCGCPTDQKPCAGACIPNGHCCTDADCPSGHCRNGVCGCHGDMGAACTSGGQCCSGICARQGIGLQCCGGVGEPCTQSNAGLCCWGLTTCQGPVVDGTLQGTCQPCRPPGAACGGAGDAPCCFGCGRDGQCNDCGPGPCPDGQGCVGTDTTRNHRICCDFTTPCGASLCNCANACVCAQNGGCLGVC